ncbi:MAG: PAS domain S-box protein [Kiritimatiellae bacterium]|nr:PAS domain S-box protein [Kiritimatiellia bacterium]
MRLKLLSNIHRTTLRRMCSQSLFLLLVTAPGFPCAAHSQNPAGRAPLVVVIDDNYPPYIFRESGGKLCGILPDQWALWEQKTGVRVDLQAMDWAEAQRLIRENRADVIDTFFFTEERAKLFAFTPSYAQIKVPVYVHKTLGGIGDIPSLKGFTVGVKSGDAVMSHLTQRGIDTLREYPSYEAIILAAKNHEIKVFTVDQPAAVFFLCKHGLVNEFRESFVLYTGTFHRAVHKHRPGLLNLVQGGFDRISRSEYRAIDRKWMGSPVLLKGILQNWGLWIFGGLSAFLTLVMGNVLLGRIVRAKTAELRAALATVRQSLAARQETERALRESQELLSLFIRHSPIHAFIKHVTATESRVLTASENFQQMIGVPGSEMQGKTMEELFPPEFAAKTSADDWAVVSKGEVLKADEELNGRYYSTTKFPLVQGGKTLLAGYTVDITELKRTEHALVRALERYNLLAKHNRIITWAIDTHGLYTDLSNETITVTGYHPKELKGKSHFYELHPEKGREEFKAKVFGALAKGEPLQDLIHPVMTESGGTAWFSSSGIPTRDDQGNIVGYWGTSTDITDHKHAEDSVRESERRYRMLTETMKDVVWIIDVETQRFIYVSPAVEKLRGFTVAEVMAGTLTNSLVPEQTEKVMAMFRQHAAEFRRGEITSNTFFTLELRQPRKDGGTIVTEALCRYWTNERTGRLELHGTTRDITDRKRAEAERERLTRAIEQSTDTILITDAFGTIVYVNPEFTKATGYTREEALGQNARILKSGMHDKEFYRQLWETLKNGKNWEGKIVNKHKNGTAFIEQVSISPVRDDVGNIVNFVAVKRDITQQYRAEEEKTALQEQLMHAQKLESVGRLAVGVAHDFNNMLQTILGYTEIALDQVPPEQPLHNDLMEIKKAAQHSTNLTRQLQAFAHKQIVAPKAINLNEAVQNMSAMLRRLIGETIRLEWKPGQDLGTVMIDPGQIDQVVVNLCINARDAIGSSGCIVIATGNVQLSPAEAHLFGDIAPGPYVQLSIQDNGCGMPPGVRNQVFEPFFTTKPVGQGTGLGLSIVYGIIRQNNGTIRVDSEPGKGSVFKIYLPRYFGAPVANEPPEDAGAPACSSHANILLVDDENSILHTTQRILESLGHKVFATTSPKNALQLFEEHSDQIDLLITDVIMPGMNGPEMVRQMLKQCAKLKYMFISGHTANLLAEQGLDETTSTCIRKPFSRKTLAQKVQEAMTQK